MLQVLPIISALIGTTTLLGLLLQWVFDTHEVVYSFMAEGQTVPFVSDNGVGLMRPVFVIGFAVSSILFTVAFTIDRYTFVILKAQSHRQKTMAWISVGLTVFGSLALTCMTIIDTARYPIIHKIILLQGLLSYLVVAIIVCYYDYRRLKGSSSIYLTSVVLFTHLTCNAGQCIASEKSCAFHWG